MDLTIPEHIAIPDKLDGSASELDVDLLARSLAAVNRKHFKNKIEADIVWAVPKGSVNVRENTDNLPLDQEQNLNFEKAISLIADNNYLAAIDLLEPIAIAGHRDSQLAMCHLLKRTHGDWKKYAEMHNNSVRILKAVAAACYYPESSTIAIHPHLFQRNVPQFVLRYLIFHECCHQIIPHEDNGPHPEALMELEYAAPHRDRAILWLEKEGFPTIRNA